MSAAPPRRGSGKAAQRPIKAAVAFAKALELDAARYDAAIELAVSADARAVRLADAERDADAAALRQQLAPVVELAEKHRALVMIDECHSTGFVGRTGRGTPELHGVRGRVGEAPITPELVLKLGWAAGRVLEQQARGARS